MATHAEPPAGRPAPAGSVGAGAFVRNRALFANFLRRELVTRYLGSVTGLAWAFLHPLALLAVYHFIFTKVFRTGGWQGRSFLVFVAVALWPWMAAQEGIQRGAVCLANYAGLIRRVAFPHELAVYAAVFATLLLQFAGYVAVMIVLWAFGEPVRFEGLLLAVPLWIVMAIAVTGVALLCAALQVFIRDVEHVLMPALMMLMFLTPILYPMEKVPEDLRVWVGANPFAWLVERMRTALLDGNPMPAWSDLLALAIALAVFAGGRWVFLRLSPHFEDFL